MEKRIARSSKGDVPWPDAHLYVVGSLLWYSPTSRCSRVSALGGKEEFQAHRKKETLQVRTPSMARSFLSVCLPVLVSARAGRHSQAYRGHPSWKFAIAGPPACRDLESASWIRWWDMPLTFLDVTGREYLRPMVTRRLLKLVCLLCLSCKC